MWFPHPPISTVPVVATWHLDPGRSGFGNRFDRLAEGHRAGLSQDRERRHEPVSLDHSLTPVT